MKGQNNPVRFAVVFVVLFLVFYEFNIWFFRATNAGGHYNAFLATHLNYIQGLRWLLLYGTSLLLKCFGFTGIFNNYELLVAGYGKIAVVYSCLGLGVLSFLTAFIIAYPKPVKSKIIAFVVGVLLIEFLNIIRFMLIALYGNVQAGQLIDHHTLFNLIIYVVISAGLYFWIKEDITVNKPYAAN